MLDMTNLMDVAKKHHQAYLTADPFPHIVIDGLFPDDLLRQIAQSFPKPDEVEWTAFKNGREKKLASENESHMNDTIRLLLYQLNSGPFLQFLEVLTGINGLLPDPYFTGGGLHQIEPGGYLKIHADFNFYPKFSLDRRLNLLLYLNEDWTEEYGGHLQLWDRDMAQCVKKVLPVFNRCVVFSTTDYSYHGHPDPLTCPPGRTRKSLALYYYSNGRPEEERSDPHSTNFRLRPNEVIEEERTPAPSLRSVVKKLVPPIVFDLKDALKKS